jgi:hypothetical protein
MPAAVRRHPSSQLVRNATFIIHHSPFVAGDYELTCLCRARIQFGGFNLTSSSNIIFSNGLLGTYYHLAERMASG